jgi:tRNA G18 (ribose-2'-O)-methylase SpoU
VVPKSSRSFNNAKAEREISTTNVSTHSARFSGRVRRDFIIDVCEHYSGYQFPVPGVYLLMAYTLIQKYDPAAVDVFRSLKGKGGPFAKGLFIAESEKIVRKVLESSIEIVSAYLTEEHFENLRPLFDARNDSTDVFFASKEEMEKVVGYPLHQGIMLACRIPGNRPFITAAQEWKSPWMAVALDTIADAENMGAIIRNAAAFGASAVIVDDQSCNPWLRRSVRVSMGTIVGLPIIRVPDLAESLRALKSTRNVRIIGAALRVDSLDLSEVTPSGNTILVFGSEGWGLRESVAQECDILARIPMADGIDSLNVAIASGIFMHHLRS